MRISTLFISSLLLLGTLNAQAQDRDKVSADQMLYEELCANHTTENYHAPFHVDAKKLEMTDESGILLLKGKSFQVKSITSDVYVKKSRKTYTPLFDEKYPVESFNNLLLNRIQDNTLKIDIRQHMYGSIKKVPTIPMQNVYDLLAKTMDIYGSVTSVTKEKMEATLVFHHRRMNFIHMFTVSIPTNQLFEKDGVITADLFGNIPQSNIKSLFSKYHE